MRRDCESPHVESAVNITDGGWFAVVLIRAGSANNQSAVTMQLWLDPEAITTDLTIGR
jgi:hypothetical protein